MKLRTRICEFLIVLILIAGCTTSGESEFISEIVFKNVNIIPMTEEKVLEDYTLIVRDGIILKLGPASSVKIPRNASVIDATGKYLIPALSDMHVHLEGDAWNIMYPPDSKFSTEDINYEDILFVYLANGITTIDVMSAFPEHIQIRNKVKNHDLLGPRLVLSRMVDGAGKAWPPPISTWVNNAEEAKKAVLEAHDTGYDRIKVYSFLDKASYDTIIKTAKSFGMPVDGHIPLSTSVSHVLESGQDMIAHSEEILNFVEGHTLENISEIAGLLAKSNTWITATLVTSRNLVKLFNAPEAELSKPGTEYLHPLGSGIGAYIYENLYKPIPESDRAQIKNGLLSFQVPFVYEFHKKGGKLLTGSDALIPPNLPGFSLHDELHELVKAGLTPYEALRVSTTNAHTFLGELESAGTIETGKNANLVLLDESPLESITNTRKIAGVMTQGKWISRKDIEIRLEQIAVSYDDLKKTKHQ